MRSQQMLQLLQSSGHLAATIGPRAGTASCVSGLLRGFLANEQSASVSGGQNRGLSAEAVPVVNDQAGGGSFIGTASGQAAAAAGAGNATGRPAQQQVAAAAAAAAAAGSSQTGNRRRNNHELTRSKEQILKDAGLWVAKDIHNAMTPQQQTQLLQQQQQYLWKVKQQQRLQEVTSCNMLVQLSPNSQQLEVVVAATAVADAMGPRRAAAIAAHAADADGSSSSSSSSGTPSRAYSSSSTTSSVVDDDSIQQQQKQQQQPTSTSSSSGGGSQQPRRRHQQPHQQYEPVSRIQQQQQTEWRAGSKQGSNPAEDDAAAAAAAGSSQIQMDFVTNPRLDRRSLVRQSGEARIVNLNSQFTNLAQMPNGHMKIVELFDELMERGLEEAQQQQEQQQQQQEQQQQQDVLVLPRQYCPDYQALGAYCRSLVWLAENVERNKHINADYYLSNRCTIPRAERAAALWGNYNMSKTTPGLQVHLALLAAYKKGGHPQKGVDLFYQLRASNVSRAALNMYRLHLYGVEAAIKARNFPAADEFARVFSCNVITYNEYDYRSRLVNIYRSLATGAAACGHWEKAMYWLQELINNYTLLQVRPSDFFAVMTHAAAAGRMDYVRMLITAADQQMKDQDGEPVIYSEEQLRFLLEAAGHARDVDFIETLWQRLLHDASSSSSSKSSAADARPSAPSYKAVIRALVDCEQWSKALDLVVEFEAAYGDTHSGPGRDFAAVSVFDGLSFFPKALAKESQVAAVFEAVKARKDAGQPVTTTLMNIICRSIARLGNTEAAGTVFQSYGVWGIAHDADSYNAIMECCEINSKVVGAESLISYMTSKGIKPNTSTWNLLFSTATRAGDRRAMVSAIERTLAAGCKMREYLVKKARPMAYNDPQLKAALDKVIRLHNMKVPPLGWPPQQQRQQQQQQQPYYGPANAEVWTPATGTRRRTAQQPEGQQQQYRDQWQSDQQQQQQPQDGEQQQAEDSSSDEKQEASGLRSQLRDVFR